MRAASQMAIGHKERTVVGKLPRHFLSFVFSALAAYAVLMAAPMFLSGGESIRFYSVTEFKQWLMGLSASSAFQVIPILLSSLIVFGITYAIFLYLLGNSRATEKRTTHGTSRMSKRSDLISNGLLISKQNPVKATSILVGGWQDSPRSKVEYLFHNGPESLLAYAPSRSGKGVALVIPCLLSYPSSAFVLDVKGELWDATAGWRRMSGGNDVIFHDPCSSDSGNARFNPLAEIRVGTEFEIKDAQNVVEYLVREETDGGNQKKDHWIQSGRILVTGVALFCLHEEKAKGRIATVSDVLNALADPDRKPRDLFDVMVKNTFDHGTRHEEIAQYGAEMAAKEDRELSSIISTASTNLGIFRDPILADATSKSDFCLLDLVNRERPLTLYLIIRPSDRDRLNGYFSMLISMLCRKLTEVLPSKENDRHELLLMLDEFSSLPAIPIVMDSLDIFAGYKVKSFIIMQDYQRLLKLYGQHETISSNCRVTIAYPPNRQETGEKLSKMTGLTTVTEKFKNTSGKRFALFGSNVSHSQTLYSRALLTPDEVMRLPVPMLDANNLMIKAGAALIFVRGHYPVLGVQTPYFFDSAYLDRSQHEAPDASDMLT